MIEPLIHRVLRFAPTIVIVGLLAALLGGYFTVLLYQNLRTDLQELLPNQERSVVDLNEIAARLKSIDSLTVLIFSQETDASRRFVDDLAALLKSEPPDVLTGVEYKITEELEFFTKRRALYMELDDLKRIRGYIRDRIDYETNIRNPLNIFSEIEIPIPYLDFHALRQQYTSRIASYTRFPGGYYATPDETKRAILLNAPGKAGDITAARRLRSAVDRAISRLNPSSYASDIEIAFTGGVQNILEEQDALVSDLKRSAVLVGAIVLLSMILYFRSLTATFALLVNVLVATLITFGLSYFLIGHLNANSAFLGSIVIGNGINFGIIFMARHLERRRKGEPLDSSLKNAARLTSTATWTAALAAGLAYGSLMITEFRGFRQFGAIGLMGMILCWIAAFTFLPALTYLLQKKQSAFPAAGRRSRWRLPRSFPRVSNVLDKGATPLWALTLIVTALALLALPNASMEVLEADLAKLRSKRSLTQGSGYYARFQDEIFRHYLSPTVILAPTQSDARRIARHLSELSTQSPDLIASVQSLDDFIPPNQGEKIAVIEEIRYLLPRRLLAQLEPSERKLAQELIRTPLRPIRQRDLPSLVLDKFTEQDGSIGNLVLVEPPLGEESRKRDQLLRYVHTLRAAADSVSPGVPVAGSLPISADTLESIARDGPKATLASLLAVILLVTVLFRNVRNIASVLFTLALGGIWLSGIILSFDIRINFLNFIALPLTFGLGVDYGVNVFQRYRQEGKNGMIAAVRNTGGAVALCCFTTVVGYGSLLIAQNRAFVSFGVLAVSGALTCVLAALVSVPAYRIRRDRKAHRPPPPSDDAGITRAAS